MKKIAAFFSILVMALAVQSCASSFRSTQLDLLMLAINGPDEVPVEDLAWTLLWSGNSYSVIPIFSPDGAVVNFTDAENEIIVAFDNNDTWQVIVAYGLLPNDLHIIIGRNGPNLDYSDLDQQVLFSNTCSSFVSSQVGTDTIRVQSCEDSSGEPYENEIRVNAAGQITQLRYMIHEDYPMITLTPNNLNFFNNN